MKHFVLGALLLGMTIPYSASASEIAPLSKQALTQILQDQDRPTEDRQRDLARKPGKILAFSQVKRSDTVLDLFAGDGWYTELFSRSVGAEGRVYAQNDEVIWRFAEEGIKQRTQDNRLPNVIRLDNIAIDKIDVPLNSVDIVFMALNYHDLFFTDMIQDGKRVELRSSVVDHKSVLSKIADVLKHSGRVIIIDHFAKPGSGYEASNVLHRIDPAIVKFQFSEAGFTLLEEAHYLRNPEDDLETSVFDPAIRGKTDRFIYKFGKL